MDWNQLGVGILAAASMIANAWQWYRNNHVEKAKANADVAIAESQQQVYEQMKERLTDLANQVNTLTAKVDDLSAQGRMKDDRIHTLELYIKDLLHLMQSKGIDPPPMP